jgi:hypothetical protein
MFCEADTKRFVRDAFNPECRIDDGEHSEAGAKLSAPHTPHLSCCRGTFEDNGRSFQSRQR